MKPATDPAKLEATMPPIKKCNHWCSTKTVGKYIKIG